MLVTATPNRAGTGHSVEVGAGLASLNELCEEIADVCPIFVFQSCSTARVCRHSPLVVCQALSVVSLGLDSSWCGNIPHHSGRRLAWKLFHVNIICVSLVAG